MRRLRRYYSSVIVCLIVMIVSGYSSMAHASCLGVPLLGDTEATCAYKKKLKQDIKQAEIDKEISRSERRLEKLRNNQGQGSGENNTNVFLSGLLGEKGNKDSEGQSGRHAQTKYEVSAEWTLGIIPAADQFDSPTLVERTFMPSGVALAYYFDKNVSVYLLMQQISITEGRNFNPIMDASGDALYFPGHLDTLQYTLYMPTIALNNDIGNGWHGLLRMGVGRNEVRVKYKSIDRSKHPNVRQPQDVTYIDNTAFMVDIGIQKWLSDVKWGCFARYISSRTDTLDYLNYMSLGSSQIGCSFTFMLRPLGML